jgi:hypothetical protein
MVRLAGKDASFWIEQYPEKGSNEIQTIAHVTSQHVTSWDDMWRYDVISGVSIT